MLINNKGRLVALFPKLLCLFESSFQKKISEEYLKWRYIDNPVGDVLFNVELDKNGELAASYSCFPVKLSANGKVLNSMMSMTTMTHPDHQGKGYFISLANGLFSYAKELGYSGVWGFPNLNSHYGFVNKLGWKDIYEIPTMLFSSDTSAVLSLGELDNSLELDGYDDLQIDGSVGLLKNKEYLRWRYVHNPVNKYDIVVETKGGIVKGYAVLKRYVSEGALFIDLVDYAFADEASRNAVIDKVIAYSKGERVLLWGSVFSVFRRGVESRRGLSHYGNVQYFSGAFWANKAMLEDPRNWNIVMGDSDVY